MSHTQSASRFLVVALSLLWVSVVAVPTTVSAMSVNVTGKWMLMVDDTEHGCMWKGPMSLTQTGMDFAGMAMLNSVSDSGCASMINGTIRGSISGTGSGFFISFGLASGDFGMVNFGGTLTDDGLMASGSWENTASGTWSAEKEVSQAPALSHVALAILFGLLTVVGVGYARRRAV